MSSRLVALLGALLAACVLLALGAAGTAGGGSVACAPRCGGESPSVSSGAGSEPVSCLHDPGCGGGATLATGLTAAFAVMVAGAASTLRDRATWRRRRVWLRQPVGVLLAAALFRPPRLLLDA